ncbi:sensor histidine kinase [Geomicrobium sediminis]|uniref:histidine kinase n=1 Tax=Geomicrobium sediminis TaxID=1347788 RepID=A0ABS2P6F3_9BACL|nr:sensor histidine kinase [Geomicrobium sediminis]MBM7630926.1 two-component system sensor histidine kinase DesK [Geomicrobium sediminis]
MSFSFYPDYAKRFLVLELVSIVFFFFNVLTYDNDVSLVLRIAIVLAILALYLGTLWYFDVRYVLFSALAFILFIYLSVALHYYLLLFMLFFVDLHKKVPIVPTLIIQQVLIIFTHAVVYILAVPPADGSYFTTVLFPVLLIQLLIPYVSRSVIRAKELREELEDTKSQLDVYVQEEERNRIARELHDTLGHTLTMMKVKSELALHYIDREPERAKVEMNDVLQTTRFASKQVREVVTTLRYTSIKEEMEHAKQLFATNHTAFIVDGIEEIPSLSQVIETMVAQSLREALVNAYKHSHAKRICVSFHYDEEQLTARITDNGVGFEEQMTDLGNGLHSIRERMKLAKGKASIHSSPKGTIVTLTIFVGKEEQR